MSIDIKEMRCAVFWKIYVDVSETPSFFRWGEFSQRRNHNIHSRESINFRENFYYVNNKRRILQFI